MEIEKKYDEDRTGMTVGYGERAIANKMTEFETGAKRENKTGKGEPVLLPHKAIVEVSKHCEEGAIAHGRDNVRKGLPQSSFCNSGYRHLVAYMDGDQSEKHLRAACWNLLWALEQELTRPDLNDLYWAKRGK